MKYKEMYEVTNIDKDVLADLRKEKADIEVRISKLRANIETIRSNSNGQLSNNSDNRIFNIKAQIERLEDEKKEIIKDIKQTRERYRKKR